MLVNNSLPSAGKTTQVHQFEPLIQESFLGLKTFLLLVHIREHIRRTVICATDQYQHHNISNRYSDCSVHAQAHSRRRYFSMSYGGRHRYKDIQAGGEQLVSVHREQSSRLKLRKAPIPKELCKQNGPAAGMGGGGRNPNPCQWLRVSLEGSASGGRARGAFF